MVKSIGLEKSILEVIAGVITAPSGSTIEGLILLRSISLPLSMVTVMVLFFSSILPSVPSTEKL